MIKHSEIEEIKKLIQNGFDLELMSFELDIPIEEIMQYKLELEKTNKSKPIKTYSAREIIDNKNKQAHSKMQQMREQYKRLFFKVDKVEVKTPKELTNQEIELINSVITEIEEIVKGMKNLSKKERRKGANVILTKIKKIENYQLTIEQSEKLHSLIQSEELEKLNLNTTDKIDFYINRTKKTIVKKLTDAMDSLKDCEGIIVLSDLAGGSPFKTAVEIGFPRGNVEVVAGTNLGMLVEINLTRTFSEDVHALAESACNVGKDQVMRYVFQHIEQNDDFSDGI